MLNEIAILVLLTFIPALELRFSIPAGILAGTVDLPLGHSVSGLGLPWYFVFAVCVIANILLGIIVYILLDKFVHIFLRFKWFSRFYHKIMERAQKKIHKYVEKYGEIGIGLFIAVPLPGSGVYTGALGAYALGLPLKKFIIADIIGVILAGAIVTLITLGGLAL